MRTFSWLATPLSVLLIGSVVTARQSPPSPQPAAPPAAKPAASSVSAGKPTVASRYVVIGSIKELMQGIVDPAADVLWEAVSYDVTAAGVVEHVPKTDEDWYAVRRQALLLAEATNLLRMPGRKVTPAKPIPGMENEPPGPEDLTPAQIQVLIDRNPAKFGRLAQGLSDAARLALKAADARSVDALFAAGDAIDQACETCHLTYWYPAGKKPGTPLSQKKKK
jgi:hypothetical protein